MNDAPATDPLIYNPGLPLNWALDFNWDPMSSTISQDHNGKVSILDEISLRSATLQNVCDRFMERITPLHAQWREKNGARPMPIKIYGDAAANTGSHQTAKSDYDLIREYFRREPGLAVEWHTNTSNPLVKDRVNAVNRMLQDAGGSVRMKINTCCKELRADFLKVSWREGQFELEKKKDKLRTHMSDAIGYQIYRDHRVDGFERQNFYR